MAQFAIIKQADLTRMAKAMRKAEVSKWRVLIRPDKTVEIIVGDALDQDDPVSDWDE